MTIVIIKDEIERTCEIREDFSHWQIEGIYNILNPREMGIDIAYELFDKEQVDIDDIKKEVKISLEDIALEIENYVIETLQMNGIEVI